MFSEFIKFVRDIYGTTKKAYVGHILSLWSLENYGQFWLPM